MVVNSGDAVGRSNDQEIDNIKKCIAEKTMPNTKLTVIKYTNINKIEKKIKPSRVKYN